MVDISYHQVGGITALRFLEEVDKLIPDHIFKKSIILVREEQPADERLRTRPSVVLITRGSDSDRGLGISPAGVLHMRAQNAASSHTQRRASSVERHSLAGAGVPPHVHALPAQVKAWCYYESRVLGAHHGLFSTYALEVLVLYVFNRNHKRVKSPIEVRPR